VAKPKLINRPCFGAQQQQQQQDRPTMLIEVLQTHADAIVLFSHYATQVIFFAMAALMIWALGTANLTGGENE